MIPSPYQALLWTVPAKAESAIITAEKEQGQLGAWPCPWPGQRLPQTLHMCHAQGKEQNHSGTLPRLMPEWEPRAISEVPFRALRPHKLPSRGKTASHPGDTQPPQGPSLTPQGPLPPPQKAANTLSPNLAPALAPLTPCLPRWQSADTCPGEDAGALSSDPGLPPKPLGTWRLQREAPRRGRILRRGDRFA